MNGCLKHYTDEQSSIHAEPHTGSNDAHSGTCGCLFASLMYARPAAVNLAVNEISRGMAK
eukprot:4079533-Amphidinium_carterae.1